jgi:hydroxymethylglutaryl-CoA lyase
MELCTKHDKKFIAYLSMGFGNPYNDPWSPETVIHWIKKLKSIGVNFFSLSDTIGVSNPERIESVIGKIKQELPNLNYGCHFHTRPDQWLEKIETAFNAGCRRFDGALKGFGGCPMAEDELVGNMPTENMVAWFKSQNIETGLNMDRFNEAMLLASEVFNNT